MLNVMKTCRISWTISSVLILAAIAFHQSQAAIVRRSTDDAPPIIITLPVSPGQFYINGKISSENNNKSAPGIPPIGDLILDEGIPRVNQDEDDILGERPSERKPNETSTSASRKKRKLEGDTWPNGVVPYVFSSQYPHSESNKRTIRDAMKWWTDSTCIRFVENAAAPVKLSISNLRGCSSYVGYQPNVKRSNNGLQVLKLGATTCFSTTGTIAHEFGHALGLIHEQSRPDRDSHINIHVDKIHGDSIHNFQTYYDATIPEGVRYDLNSIMHYSPKSFALYSNKPTITAKNPTKDVLMGQRSALSFYDLMAVNKAYCQGNCVNHCLNEGYTIFKDGRCKCVCPEGLTGSRCERAMSSGCGGEITLTASQERTIKTPNYPRNYRNEKCTWLVTAPANHLVQIYFQDFEVTSRDGVRCSHSVEVRNNVLGQRGDILCGNGTLGPFDTRLDHMNNQMMVVFDSTDQTTASGKGFTATVKAFRDGCMSSPCENGGTCVSSSTTAYSCSCGAGYTGSRCEKASDAAVNCDFADDMCMFKNDASDQLDMRRMFISTKYLETVKHDHNNNRFFIAAPAEFETGIADEARLVSPVFTGNKVSKRCLKFAYHMSGSYQARGQLAVSMKNVRGNSITNLFTKHGDQREGWKNAVVEINNQADYEIIFVIRTSDIYRYNSLIAIDDISIEPHSCSDGPCTGNPCSASDGTCVEPSSGGHYCLCPQGRSGSRCNNYDTNGFTCDFESDDLCGWTNSNGDNFDWSQHYGVADQLRRTGPVAGMNGAGSYMLADSSSSQAGIGRTAKLISPKLDTNGAVCVEFSYHMWGAHIGSLEVKTKARGIYSSAHYTLRGSQSSSINEWKTGRVTVTSTMDTQLIFEVVSGVKHVSDIAIDKVKISRGACAPTAQTTPNPAATAAPRRIATTPSVPRRFSLSLSSRLRLSIPTTRRPQSTRNSYVVARRIGGSGSVLVGCDFETNDCSNDFVNIPNTNQQQWIRTDRTTPSAETGPGSAYQGRYYMYVEASDQAEGDTNTLTTHLIYNSDKKACVTFDYSMYGTGVGSLSVEMKSENGNPRSVWRMTGNQGQAWKKAEIDIDMNNNFYQIMFKSTRGATYKSDIAIDDIKITRNQCSTNRQQNRESSSSAAAARINIVCDFEGGRICSPNIRQSTDDNFDFMVNTGGTPTAGTGPDSAASGSKYAMIEASSRNKQETAKLETATVPANSGTVCLTLNYHMEGIGIGTLKIFQKHSGGSKDEILTLSGSQSSQWLEFEKQIDNDSQPYSIEIEARLSRSAIRYAGDIALDNFSLVSGTC